MSALERATAASSRSSANAVSHHGETPAAGREAKSVKASSEMPCVTRHVNDHDVMLLAPDGSAEEVQVGRGAPPEGVGDHTALVGGIAPFMHQPGTVGSSRGGRMYGPAGLPGMEMQGRIASRNVVQIKPNTCCLYNEL